MIISPRFEHRKNEGAKKAKNFELEAQAVWAESSLDKKRELIISTMIDNFKYKEKIEQFKQKVLTCNSCITLDTLAGDIMLYGQGLSVLK